MYLKDKLSSEIKYMEQDIMVKGDVCKRENGERCVCVALKMGKVEDFSAKNCKNVNIGRWR